MAYETFDFGGYVPSWNYPKGNSFKFGQGYTFAIKPQAPIQRVLKLSFQGGLVWFQNANGTINNTTQPTINMQRLCEFYDRHLTHVTFILPHPVWGNTYVKFDAENPFNVPPPVKGGSGVTESFEMQLIEQVI